MSAHHNVRCFRTILGVALSLIAALSGALGVHRAAAQSVQITQAPASPHVGHSAPITVQVTTSEANYGCSWDYDLGFYCDYWSYALGSFAFAAGPIDATPYFSAPQYVDQWCDGYGYCETRYLISSGGAPLPVEGATTLTATQRFYYAAQSGGSSYTYTYAGQHQLALTNWRNCTAAVSWDRWPGQSPDWWDGPYGQRRGDFAFSYWIADVETWEACGYQTQVDPATFRFEIYSDAIPGRVATGEFQNNGTAGAVGNNILLYPSTRNAYMVYAEFVRPDGSRFANNNNWATSINTAQPCRVVINNTRLPDANTTATSGPFAYTWAMVDPNAGNATCTDATYPLSAQFTINGADRTGSLSYTRDGASGGAVPLFPNATNTAVLTMVGRDAAAGEQRATVTHTVQVSAPGAIALTLDHARNGPTLDRALCLTVALPSEAASECGDLRIVHALPTTRTLNKARTPVLLYNSRHGNPAQTVAATITLPSGALPERVEARLIVNEVQRERATWPGTAWRTDGSARRVAIVYHAAGDGTWVYPYRLEVSAFYAGEAQPRTTTQSGELVTVNRTSSPYGGGWWVDGLEWIQGYYGDGNASWLQNRMLWVGGDGSTALYRALGDGRWVGPSLTRPDTIVFDGGRGVYVRRLAGGGRVEYDGAGRHIATVNRLGHTTRFTYKTVAGGASALDSIVLPTPSGTALGYRFDYDAAGKLRTVTAPKPNDTTDRVVTLTTVNGAVQRIEDADRNAVQFSYRAASWAPTWITDRYDRRGTRTRFEYYWARSVGQASTTVEGGREVTTALQQGDERIVWPSPGKAPLHPDSVYTLIDGPRTDSADVTKVWLNGYGAPTRIFNAINDSTRLTYDSTWPGLVASVIHANGFTSRAEYDQRGNLKARTDLNPLRDGRDALTRYEWDPLWDAVTRIQTPEGTVTQMQYDGTTGNRLWQQTGGSDRRVNYAYYAGGSAISGLLMKTVLPVGRSQLPPDARPLAPSDSVGYDALGNLNTYLSTGGSWQRYTNDAVGRVRITETQIDGDRANPSAWQADTLTYDPQGRVIRRGTGAPALGNAPAKSFNVVTTYDAEGATLTVSRTATPGSASNPGGIGTITNRWVYDTLGRAIQTIAADGQYDAMVYDDAGNVVKVSPRRRAELSDTIRMEYDALNRLKRRTLPAVTYASRFAGVATQSNSEPAYPRYLSACDATPNANRSSSSYSIAGETQDFTYDQTGGIATANGGDARVTRTYLPNGLLDTEALQVRNTCTADFGHTYLTSSQYDRDGRRVSLTYPAQLSPGGATRGSAQFGYDVAGTGVLTSVTDMLSNSFGFDYSVRGELVTLTRPLGVVESLGYGYDGLVSSDLVTLGSGATQQRSASFARDPRGSLLRMSNTSGLKDVQTATYDGLGQAFNTSYTANGTNLAGYAITGTSSDALTHDALGNLVVDVANTSNMARSGAGDQTQWSNRNISYAFDTRGTGRLLTRTAPYLNNTSVNAYMYDSAGNVVFEGETGTTWSDRASYYGADGKLRAADARTVSGDLTQSSTPYRATFEEYRYDALGRRVWVRARRTCRNQTLPAIGTSGAYSRNGECRTSTVRRTVWDGEQELGEIQMPAADNTAADQMENDVDVLATQPRTDSDDWTHDPNQFFGRVAYTFGGSLDQPLGATRMRFTSVDRSGARVELPDRTIVPLWNQRGQAEDGYVAGGACVGGRCYQTEWPSGWFPYMRQFYAPTVWHGSLLVDKADKTGTYYRRNRYYDPASGRFTQEDPIGLAGGLNLYGFAGGDPVTYSDPFGLCPAKTLAEVPQCLGQTLVPAERALNIYAGGIAAGAVAVAGAEALGVMAGARIAFPASGAALGGAGTKIALGISDHLDEFAGKFGASTWKEWGATNFKEQFMGVMGNAKNKILFNLDGVDVWGGVQRAAGGRGGATDWELLQIRNNPQWWDRMQFVRNGSPVNNPFQR